MQPMFTTLTVPFIETETNSDILTVVESALKYYVLENRNGTFRWHEDISDLHLFCSRYRLDFVQSSLLLGFNIPFKNTVALTLKKVGVKPNYFLSMKWEISSLRNESLCKNIIKETELAIRDALQEEAQENLVSQY
jgi:hypothetical protein